MIAEHSYTEVEMLAESKQVIHLLLVEDHLPDVVLTKKAFERGKYPVEIHVVRDGEEALSFLFREGVFQNAIRPDLILLDINLPKKSGYEVLEEIKDHAELRSIPVIMLTSSEAEQDVTRSYSLHANSYLVKPSSLSKFVELVNYIESFWFKVVKLTR